MSSLSPIARCSPVDDGEAILNWDVLTEIMSHLSRRDTSRMARTCRTLLQVSPRFLLAGTVTLALPETCLSFCKFMARKDRKDCYRYLRRLDIPLSQWITKDKRLGNVFTKATELEWLSLGRGHVLAYDDRICDAVIGLTKLHTLVLNNPSKYTLQVVEKMQAALTTVDADLYDFERRQSQDPVVTFAPFKDSLELMAVISPVFRKKDSQFPRVHSLFANDATNVKLQILTGCFPNLQNLHLSVAINGFSGFTTADTQRAQNQVAQAQVAWPSLRRLSGSVEGLYTLALNCGIDHLSVASTLLTANDEQRLRLVLSDVRGLQSLYLKLKLPDFNVATLERTLAPVQGTLGELMLRFDYRGRNYEEVAPYLSAMLEKLSAFPLHTLRLCVRWFYNGPQDDAPSGLNHRVIAEWAMRCVASLRHVYVEIEPWAAEFDVQSHVEADGRLTKVLLPLGEDNGFVEPDVLFSNDFFQPWLRATGAE
ncbi:hypothetical protein PsYK624_027320 [Phanerochaete sordida]|uniref:F-box domain-containing protein n=1 Tax=Phanerochaete sordida TaxID=48140 RepID=A0A9P3L8Y7_9APHY|nr:hypothetical protein PsYK624_027320 [Phanerochaete sordida]